MAERNMTMREALNLALEQALARDERVFLLGEDIADASGGGILGVTNGLSTKYGEDRVIDTPISEAAITGAAIGAALDGRRPVAEIMMMDFIGIAMDQIVNHAAKMRYMTAGRTTSPITVRAAVVAGMGTGATHSQSLESWFMGVPGIKVVMPSSPADAKGLLTTAIFDDDPVLFLEPVKLLGARGMVPVEEHAIPFGQANTVRIGTDVTIVTYGWGVPMSQAAAAELEAEGISVEILDLRTLLPLDVPAMLEAVNRTRRAVVVTTSVRFGGPSAEIAATLTENLFDRLVAPVARVGAQFTPIPSAPVLEAAHFPDAERIADAVRRTVGVRAGVGG
ncbi:alpha-ketoacid dehydrogenase subunit beta [Streptomyces fuscichromogenes]|uniref:Pyruvate dehydrogenase subunit beta n=1 Tax=Streptomyces fuscichromogenes TaxID=1324013 RepID=A0A918CPB1_9ACTN|nr:pyruvate dehydrogenase complex E1 component subunit beta [Streptomyces fuscichromogenes]GGM97935.1 pyruvate dehydrogenase subunit beta [Streptomyces fuscichromogenes]